MKPKILYTLLILFLLTPAGVWGQDYSVTVDSGYVFIDGEYIEPPYNLYSKNDHVYINHKMLNGSFRVREGKNLPIIESEPVVPEELKKEISVFDINNTKTEYSCSFGIAIKLYAYQNFDEAEARLYLARYYEKLPCISYTRRKINAKGEIIGIIIKDFSNQELHVYFDNPEIQLNEVNNNNIGHRIKARINLLVSALERNELILFANGSPYEFMRGRSAKHFLKIVSEIQELNSRLDDETINKYKRSTLFNLDRTRIDFLEKPKNNRRLLKRYKQSIQNEKRSIEYETDIQDEDFSSGTFVPKNNIAVIWYANYFERTDPDYEIGKIKNGLYTVESWYDRVMLFEDLTGNDNNIHNCTWQNWQQIQNAGIIFINGHSNQDHQFIALHFNDANGLPATEIIGWNSQVNNGVHWGNSGTWIDEYGDTQTGGCVVIEQLWVAENWHDTFNNNNSLVFIGMCTGSDDTDGTSFAENCGGAVIFGFPVFATPTKRGDYYESLLNRMNGSINDGKYRTARSAYWNMPFIDPMSLYAWECLPGNKDVTLAPSIQKLEPSSNDFVGATGTAKIYFDTYCDAVTYPAEQIFDQFEFTGNVEVSNIRWDEVINGASTVIAFDWQGNGEFSIDVSIDPFKIYGWNIGSPLQSHRLDWDGIGTTPDYNPSYVITGSDTEPDFIPSKERGKLGSTGLEVEFRNITENFPEGGDHYYEWHFFSDDETELTEFAGDFSFLDDLHQEGQQQKSPKVLFNANSDKIKNENSDYINAVLEIKTSSTTVVTRAERKIFIVSESLQDEPKYLSVEPAGEIFYNKGGAGVLNVLLNGLSETDDNSAWEVRDINNVSWLEVNKRGAQTSGVNAGTIELVVQPYPAFGEIYDEETILEVTTGTFGFDNYNIQYITIYRRTVEDPIIINSPVQQTIWEYRVGESTQNQTISFDTNIPAAINTSHFLYYYSSNNGISWIQIPESDYTASMRLSKQRNSTETTTFLNINWTMPAGISSEECRIKVMYSEDKSAYSISNRFTIRDQDVGFILIARPAAVIQAGDITDVTWSSSNVENIKLQLSTGSTDWETLKEAEAIAASSGEFTWEVPTGIEGSFCRMKILEIKSDGSEGISNVSETFRIEDNSPKLKLYFDVSTVENPNLLNPFRDVTAIMKWDMENWNYQTNSAELAVSYGGSEDDASWNPLGTVALSENTTLNQYEYTIPDNINSANCFFRLRTTTTYLENTELQVDGFSKQFAIYNGEEDHTIYVSKNSIHPVEPYDKGWETAATSIAMALPFALDNITTILVDDGIYYEEAELLIENGIIVKSKNGPLYTIIDGSVNGTKGNFTPVNVREYSILDGFTVQNSIRGGVVNYHSTIKNCIVRYNGQLLDTDSFGGISNDKGYVINCIIYENKGSFNGGIELYHDSHVYNSTVIRNEVREGGRTGGIGDRYEDDPREERARGVVIANTIIAENYRENELNNYGLYEAKSFYNCSDPVIPTAIPFESYNFNPQFTDIANNNVILSSESACVDAVTIPIVFPPTDIFGRERTVGAPFDIGAIEGTYSPVNINISQGIVEDAGVTVVYNGNETSANLQIEDPWFSSNKIITTSVDNTDYEFIGWNDGNLTNPRTFTYRDGGKSFNAIFKKTHMTNAVSAFANNNQQKLIKDAVGNYHMVYESMERVFYEKSTDGGTNWQFYENAGLINNGMAGSDPSLDSYGNDVIISYISGNDINIKLLGMNEVSIYNNTNSNRNVRKPVVAINSDRFVVMWEEGIKDDGDVSFIYSIKYAYGQKNDMGFLELFTGENDYAVISPGNPTPDISMLNPSIIVDKSLSAANAIYYFVFEQNDKIYYGTLTTNQDGSTLSASGYDNITSSSSELQVHNNNPSFALAKINSETHPVVTWTTSSLDGLTKNAVVARQVGEIVSSTYEWLISMHGENVNKTIVVSSNELTENWIVAWSAGNSEITGNYIKCSNGNIRHLTAPILANAENYALMRGISTIDECKPFYLMPSQNIYEFAQAELGAREENYNVDLEANWNWISFNVNTNQLDLDNIFANSTISDEDYIKNQFGYSQFYDDPDSEENDMWLGSLSAVNYTEMFKTWVTNPVSVNYAGTFLYPDEIQYTLYPGWNWVGYPLDKEQNIGHVLKNMNPTEGDEIISLLGHAVYTASVWDIENSGLISFKPGTGYMIFSQNEQTFYYPFVDDSEIPAENPVPLFKQELDVNWALNPYAYEHRLTLAATINSEEVNDNDMLGVFVGDECRGMIKAKYVQSFDQRYFFILVCTNEVDEETYNLRYYSSSTGEEYKVIGTRELKAYESYGSLNEPVQLSLEQGETVSELPTEYNLEHNYPNPFNPSTTIKYAVPQDAHVRLEIYNMLGQRVCTLVNETREAGYYTTNWNAVNDYGEKISSGIYILRMQSGSYTKLQKMVFLK